MCREWHTVMLSITVSHYSHSAELTHSGEPACVHQGQCESSPLTQTGLPGKDVCYHICPPGRFTLLAVSGCCTVCLPAYKLTLSDTMAGTAWWFGHLDPLPAARSSEWSTAATVTRASVAEWQTQPGYCGALAGVGSLQSNAWDYRTSWDTWDVCILYTKTVQYVLLTFAIYYHNRCAQYRTWILMLVLP